MSQLDPPYPLIREALTEGRVIPFLGSGASLGGPPTDPATDARTSGFPTAAELAGRLARATQFPDDEPLDLAKVAQYYDVVGGRRSLHRELHRIFDSDYPCSSIHELLADIDKPLLIITTNYDDLIERAFLGRGRPYDVVVHVADPAIGDRLLWWPNQSVEPREVSPNKLDIDLSSVAVIYKMHGGVDRRAPERDQYVITEDDYIDFLARMTRNKAIPAMFAEALQSRHFLFLGYGLSDWNLRVVLNRIERDLRRPRGIKSWAIQYQARRLERRFWQERGVEMYDMTIDEFVENLSRH